MCRYVKRTSPSRRRRILGCDRLLHLQQQLGAIPDIIDRHDLRARALVVRIRQRAAVAGGRLDQDVVSLVHELARARRRQRDPVLIGFDLLWRRRSARRVTIPPVHLLVRCHPRHCTWNQDSEQEHPLLRRARRLALPDRASRLRDAAPAPVPGASLTRLARFRALADRTRNTELLRRHHPRPAAVPDSRLRQHMADGRDHVHVTPHRPHVHGRRARALHLPCVVARLVR